MLRQQLVPPALLALLPLASCAVAPTRPIPDPLPEVLEWARPAADGSAYLGLEVRENDSGSLEALSFEPGVRVTAVAPDSPAAAAGFTVGDVLLEWDGVAVDDPGTLDALLEGPAAGVEGEPGGARTLRVRRGDSVFDVQVTLRSLAAADAAPPRLVWRSDPARSRAGWLAGRGGVVLVTSDPDGPFVRAGVDVGSVVTTLDGERVLSERALIRALQAKEPGARVKVAFRSPPEGGVAGAGGDGDGTERSARVTLYSAPSRVTEATLPILAGYRSNVEGTEKSFYLIDLWIISLFKYRREGQERHWTFLRFFTFSRGVGVLSE